tara:strand:+ start:60 stop:239 length:180 start_codon:yes stop_codon:yes gene_type:complete
MEFQHAILKSDKEFILPAVKVPMTDYQPPVKKSQNPASIFEGFKKTDNNKKSTNKRKKQ